MIMIVINIDHQSIILDSNPDSASVSSSDLALYGTLFRPASGGSKLAHGGPILQLRSLRDAARLRQATTLSELLRLVALSFCFFVVLLQL